MQRKGDWMQTVSGRQFWPLDPRPEEIDLGDIAHALSNQCRFAGHTREFYSVAEHSVRVSQLCDQEDALWGLLHDASEAYLVDLPRPVKRQPELAAYRAAEDVVMRAVCKRFGLPPEMPRRVHHYDQVLLATEARDLMCHPPNAWAAMPDPHHERIIPWSSRAARQTFLDRFQLLTRWQTIPKVT